MKQTSTTRGFTLLEMTVSIGVFSILMLMGTVALFTTIHAQRKTAASQRLIQNLDFAVDSMIREIRTGTTYYCGPEATASDYSNALDCTNDPGSPDERVIAVERFGGDSGDINDQVVFRLENGTIEKSIDAGANFVALTSDTVTIDSFIIKVWGTGAGDQVQPRVFILLTGTAGIGTNAATPFTIQTTVSQRTLDS